MEYPRSSILRARARQAAPDGLGELDAEAERGHVASLRRRLYAVGVAPRPRLRRRPWAPDSWRTRPAAQQPVWPDGGALKQVHARWRAAAAGLRRGGPPSDPGARPRWPTAGPSSSRPVTAPSRSPSSRADSIRDKLKVILQMAVVLTYGAGVPVVKVGRIAGQFAKPRSSPTERVDGEDLDTFRGHMVNDDLPTAAARVPDPNRLSPPTTSRSATLNLLRAFTKGGFADLSQIHAWNQEFVASSRRGPALRGHRRGDRPRPALHGRLRHRPDREDTLHQVDFWTSHEALHPRLRRGADRRGFDHRRLVRLLGAHALGGRADPAARRGPRRVPLRHPQPHRLQDRARARPPTRSSACASGSIRTGPGPAHADHRMGVDTVDDRLPPLLRAVVTRATRWCGCATRCTATPSRPTAGARPGASTTSSASSQGFFAAHRAEGTWPGGVHVELTGDDVTECLGGVEDIVEDQLHQRYTTTCDPASTAASRWTWRSASPSCCEADEAVGRAAVRRLRVP